MDIDQDRQRPKEAALNAVLRGSFFALCIQSMSTIVLLAAQHYGGQQIAIVGLASFAMTSIGGFLMIARRVTSARATIIGIVYFPTMFGLMFLEAIIFDARLYGNTF